MANFNFIAIPELRQCLESDYKELQTCLKAEAWKAVHVLAGSIVEAVLIDALSGAGVDQSKLDTMDLAALIAQAKDKGFLDEEAKDLSTVIRKYRNLIHPGRVKRLEKTVNRSGAAVAVQVVEIISTQVAQQKQKTYGFTAEELLQRLRGGSSALPLVNHLISETPKPEIERLLIHVLPNAYFEAIADPESTPEQDRHLTVCHRTIFYATDVEVKTKVTKHLYEVYKTYPEELVLEYEDNFFRGSDLAYLPETERRLIKAHFLPRVSLETLDERLYNIVGIGPFLDAQEASTLSLTLILAAKGEDLKLAKRARSRLLNEYSRMRTEIRAEVRSTAEEMGVPEILARLNASEEKIAIRIKAAGG
jgi:hypothetical protein